MFPRGADIAMLIPCSRGETQKQLSIAAATPNGVPSGICCWMERGISRATISVAARSARIAFWRWRAKLSDIGRVWDLIEARLSELDPAELMALELVAVAVAVAVGADAVVLDGLIEPSARAALDRTFTWDSVVGEITFP